MSRRTGWSSSRRRVRPSTPDLVVWILAAVVLVAAVTHAVQIGRLSLSTIIFIGVLIPTIMFHEVSHGVVAYWCGDDTAKRAGRLSLNPMRHLDPIGSVIVPIGLVLLGGPGFGWARPVPVALNRLRHPRNQAILVALAGPFSNAILAAGAAVGLHFLLAAHPDQAFPVVVTILSDHAIGSGAVFWLGTVIGFIGLVNLFIGAFNLLPIPPLDGSALLERFIPIQALPTYYRIRMAFIIVVLVFVFLDRGLLGSLYVHLSNWYLTLVIR